MHEVVDCIPPSGNENSYDTTEQDIEYAKKALESDLQTAIEVYQSVKSDEESQYIAFANLDENHAEMYGRAYDTVFEERNNVF